jgi:hypothetical protein
MRPIRSTGALTALSLVFAMSAAAQDAPRIERVEPFEATPGGQLELFGSDFSPDPAQNLVEVAGRPATVLQAAPDHLVVSVPRGTWTGALRVTVGGAQSNAQVVRVAGSRGRTALGGAPADGNKAGLASRAGPLLEKAIAHDQNYQLRHSPDGLTVDAFFDDTLTTIVQYTNEGDAALWTGTYLAAQALRHATTGEPEALANALRALDGLRTLTEITGKRGLWGRNFFRNSTQYYSGNGELHDGTGAFAGHRWRGNVSRDQYSGLIFGFATAWDVSPDPTVRAQCAEHLAAMADHFIASNHRIMDVDGQPTTHGDVTQSVLGVRVTNPVHALIVLSALKAAAVSNPNEPKYAQAYAQATRRYSNAVPNMLILDFGARTKWYNFNLAFQPLYTLLRFETDPGLRARYEDALHRRVWGSVRDTFNSLFTFIHAARAPGRYGGADWISVHEAIWSLQLFDGPPHRHRAVDGSRFVRKDRIAQALFGVDQARDPVPIHLRPRSDFMWQRSPYAYRSPEDLRIEYPGVDYLVAYWMGRYHGLVASDM